MSAPRSSTWLKFFLIAALIAGGVFAALFGLREPAVVASVTRDVAVDAVPASIEVLADSGLQQLRIEGSGRVVVCEALDQGRTFKAKDVLLQLDTTDLDRVQREYKRDYDAKVARIEATVQTSQAELQVAKKTVEDAERLQKVGRASVEDVNRANRELGVVTTRQAIAKLDREKLDADYNAFEEGHKTNLAKMKIVAPVDGMVEGSSVAMGAFVNGGSVVATFYSTKRVVIARVSEEDFAKVQLGDSARMQLISLPNRVFDAKVAKILPFADAQTRRYMVHLEVDADLALLTPNATGEATITTDKHDNVPLVPRRAISYGNVVYVVKNGRVERRQIELGFRGLNVAEVTKGLEPGEQVIVEKLDQFRNGQRVQAVTEEEMRKRAGR